MEIISIILSLLNSNSRSTPCITRIINKNLLRSFYITKTKLPRTAPRLLHIFQEIFKKKEYKKINLKFIHSYFLRKLLQIIFKPLVLLIYYLYTIIKYSLIIHP